MVDTAAATLTPFDKDTNDAVVREALRSSEKWLDAQLAVVSSLSQRAGAMAAMLGASATAMLGAELVVLAALSMPLNLWTYGGALVAPGIMFVGCAFCGSAARSSKFYLPGNFPSAWFGNHTEEDLHLALIGELDNYDKYIRDNGDIISRHALWLRIGLRCGFASPLVLAAIGAACIYFQGLPSVVTSIGN